MTLRVELRLVEKTLLAHNIQHDGSRVRRGKIEMYFQGVLVAVYDHRTLELIIHDD